MEVLEILKLKYPKGEWISQLMQKDDHVALRFLLEHENFGSSDLDTAFQEALCTAPNCLDIIIKFAVKNSLTFTLPNSYHLLITTRKPPENKLVECTRVLIENGFDIYENASITGWYPLYTVLRHSLVTLARRESFDGQFGCASLLLEAGADPNFRFCGPDPRKCRRAESAVDALAFRGFSPFGFPLKYHAYFANTVELLVKHGCDTSERNNNDVSLLKIYLENTTEIYNLLPNDVDIGDVTPLMHKTIGCLIYGGSDILYKDVTRHCQLPFTHFIKCLTCTVSFRAGGGSHLEKLKVVVRDFLETVCSFLKFMNISAAQEVLKQSLGIMDSYNRDGKLTDFREIFVDVPRRHFSSFLCLESLCLVKLWNIAGKRFVDIEMPKSFKDSIKDLLFITF